MRLRVLDADTGVWALLLHGFTRNGGHLETLAQALAAAGIGSIRPDIGSFNWFRSVNNAGYLTRVAMRVDSVLTGPCVIVGHSAGGAAAAYLASRIDEARGLVFVDANESPTHLIARAWPDVARMPAFAICAPPNRCNRHGAFAQWAKAQGIAGCTVDGMGHGDVEGVERAIYRVVCGDASNASTRGLVQALVLSVTQRFLGLPQTADPWGSPHVHAW